MTSACQNNEQEEDTGVCGPQRQPDLDPDPQTSPSPPIPYRSQIARESFAQEFDSFGLVHRGLAAVSDVLDYLRFRSKFRDTTDEFRCLLRHFISNGAGRRCLRLVFDDDREAEIGPNWLTLSLNDIERGAREAGRVVLALERESFDAVFCIGIGRISRPESLVAELKRVLRKSGEIWVHTPLCGPYRPPRDHEIEYWRYTPDGLRVLLESFDEIFASVYLPEGNSMRPCSFFYGLKPADAVDGGLEATH